MRPQSDLFEYFNKNPSTKRYGRLTHGGDLRIGQRKLERPLKRHKSIHLTLKSLCRQHGLSMLLPRNQLYIHQLVQQKAKRFGIKITEFANVGNHLHLQIRIPSRQNFQSFLRSITGLIARFVSGARRGNPFGKFWQSLAHTRILTSHREEINLCGYIKANQIEASHSRGARKAFLNVFYSWSYTQRAQLMRLDLLSAIAKAHPS